MSLSKSNIVQPLQILFDKEIAFQLDLWTNSQVKTGFFFFNLPRSRSKIKTWIRCVFDLCHVRGRNDPILIEMTHCMFCANFIFYKKYVEVKFNLTLPKSHLSPYIPASHPFGQLPVTWSHCTPPLQLPQLCLHPTPYVWPAHSVINI